MAFGQRNDPVLEGIEDGINCISYPEQKRRTRLAPRRAPPHAA